MNVEFGSKLVKEKCIGILDFNETWQKAYGICQPHAYITLFRSGYLDRRKAAPSTKHYINGCYEYKLTEKGLTFQKLILTIFGEDMQWVCAITINHKTKEICGASFPTLAMLRLHNQNHPDHQKRKPPGKPHRQMLLAGSALRPDFKRG